MDIGSRILNAFTPTPAAAPPPPPPPPPEAPPAAAPAAAAPQGFVAQVLPALNGSVADALARGLPMLHDAAADVPALKQIFANRELEKTALAAVPDALKASYAKAGELLDEAPRAHLGVQLDLLQGKGGANPLLIGMLPGGGVGDKAAEWLKGKVDDVGKYAQKRLGMVWEEQPAVTEAPDDAAVAAKLGADSVHGLKYQEAYTALPAADKARLDRVIDAVKDNPGAIKRLEAMVVDGRLGAGSKLLQNLDKLATQPLAPEIPRGALLEGTIREIHDPTTVNQKHRNTCGAATVQSYLAAQDPTEYVRLVGELAGPDGKATTKSGATLKRDKTYMDGSDNGRTISSRLLQPAIMDRASIGTYDNKADGTPVPGLDLAIPGMAPHGMAGVMAELTGEGRKTVWNTPGIPNHAYVDGTPTKPVPVLVNYPQGGPDLADKVGPHWISVTGVDKAKGTVTYRNPWGREETVSQKEFDKHVYAVVRPVSASPVLA